MQPNKDMLVNIALVVIAVGVTFLLLEGVFRIYLGNNLSYEYRNGAWFLEPEQQGFTHVNGKVATINEHGFRGEYNADKNAVLVLGDSFTFGYCLADNETLPYRTEQVLADRFGCDVEFVNAGVPGYGVHHMIALYEQEFASYPVDHVVLTMIEPDVLRQPSDASPYAERRMVARKLIRSSSFLAFMKPRLDVFRQFITGRDELSDTKFDEYLHADQQRIAAFQDRLQEQNKTLILHAWVYEQNQTGFYHAMQRFAEQEDIPILANHYPAVVEDYGEERDALYCSDGHPSPRYTARAAETLSAELHPLIRDACQAPPVNGNVTD